MFTFGHENEKLLEVDYGISDRIDMSSFLMPGNPNNTIYNDTALTDRIDITMGSFLMPNNPNNTIYREGFSDYP